MNEIGNVMSTVKPEPVSIDQHSVWVAENIQEVEAEDGIAYIYDLKQFEKDEYIRMEIRSTQTATSITFVKMAESGTIDDTTATEHLQLFSPWASGINYKVNDLRKFKNALYKCIQAHTSQADWEPDLVPAMWIKIGDPAEEWPAWSQPIGAHDAYELGAKVNHNDKHWVSSVAANIWEPGTYGWEEQP